MIHESHLTTDLNALLHPLGCQVSDMQSHQVSHSLFSKRYTVLCALFKQSDSYVQHSLLYECWTADT